MNSKYIMCGITGIIGLEDKTLIKQMTDLIQHRGPDADGFFLDKNVSLGHRRLSIIDLSKKGEQPMTNEDGSIVIVFNGEIYNFLELRPELEKKGHKFSSNTDTEIILHAYEEYGYDCLKYFNGMFAFAIWDANKKILFAARDRAGQKPLYYALNDDKFIFASELKAISGSDLIPKELDYGALFDYFNHKYIPAPKTIFKNCKKLRASEFLVFNFKSKTIQTKKYWSTKNLLIKNNNLNESLKHFDDELEKSVNYRLISDVPLGCFLSGGIDSSIIVSKFSKLMQKQGGELKTFSIGFENQEFDESKYAKQVADIFSTNHKEMFVKENMMKLIPKLVWHYDEPFADNSSLPTYYVSKMARKNVTVALSGDGGDELFAGYVTYTDNKIDQIANFHKNLPRLFKKLIYKLSSSVTNSSNIYLKTIKEGSFMSKYNDDERFIYKQILMKNSLKKSLFSEKITSKWNLNSNSELEYQQNILKDYDEKNKLSRKTYIDINSYLPENILMKVDKASMATSLETRAPFLDYNMIEFSRSLNSKHKILNNEKKYLLKKYLESKIPKNLIYRRKQGFNVPINEWFSKQININELVLSNDSILRKICNKKELAKLVDSSKSKIKHNGAKMWSLMWFELWYKEYIENIPHNKLEKEFF